ncbi:hypothetical protein [Xanthocytophaga flava]|uniref:hypothetical protein n=1 Tax=Xanthocytophaga flava TaxID=3048013 RepID=UPI0028D416B0|nr:hypothetical protein [Xanthocytophaga flavus]MDJ1468162.1 hypothetical protein [Xanthocytophaga flavus]
MKSIKLHVVLAEIDQAVRDNKPHEFSLQYIKKDGTAGKKTRVRKSGTNPAKGNQADKSISTDHVLSDDKEETSNFRYNIKEKGILLLHDVVNDQPFSLKIALLTHYNGIRIKH